MASLDPPFVKLRAQMGAHALHAKHDSRVTTAPGRKAAETKLNERLIAQIPGYDALPRGEQRKRLKHARSAHYRGMRLKGLQAERREGSGA